MRSRKGRLFNKILAIFIALSFNVGIFDGAIRLVAQELKMADFNGFVQFAWADSSKGEKNKNTLPPTAGKKEAKDPKEEEAKLNHEDKSKRTLNSKTYAIGENKFKNEVYLEPVHYKNNKNEMVDIDNNLVEEKLAGFNYANKANSMKVRFADKANGEKLARVEDKGFNLSWAMVGSKDAVGEILNNSITYRNILDSTDLRYTIEVNSVKEDIILNDYYAPREFKFELKNNSLEVLNTDQGIEFLDAKGEIVWLMPKPFMYDAKGERSDDVKAVIEEAEGKTYLTIKADASWISQSERAFPIIIDPTIKPGPVDGRDTFISSKLHDDNFRGNNNLYVGNTPAYGDTKTFIRFPLPNAGKIYVKSAVFNIYGHGGTLKSANLYPVRTSWDWNDNTLTWDYWNQHKSVGSIVSGTTGNSSGMWWKFNAKSSVQYWADNPTENNGFVIYPNGSGYQEFISCDDDSNQALRPMLVYEYSTTPPITPIPKEPPPLEPNEKIITPKPELKPEFVVHVDRKSGSVKIDGNVKNDTTEMKEARIYLSSEDGQEFEAEADDTGDWSVEDISVDNGVTNKFSMYYEFDYDAKVEITTTTPGPKPGDPPVITKTYKTITLTETSGEYKQEFLTTNYSKQARLKKMAKFYYGNGALDTKLKEDNKVSYELDLVVGDYILVVDPLKSEPYTTGEIVTNPDAEYRLREKSKPLYANGEIIGNSVDAATGNFFDMELDLGFDGKEFATDFTRTLNSQQDEMVRGPLGINWEFNYTRMLVMYENGTVEVTGGDGGGIFFYPYGLAFTSEAGVNDRLVRNGDGTFTMITEDDIFYQFNGEGMLVSITDSNGNQLNLIYDPEGLLKQVIDAGGRTTTLTYDAEGKIRYITDPEYRQVEYRYNDEGLLNQVVDPEWGVTTYEYNGYKIKKIIDALGYPIVDNSYDVQDRVQAQIDAAGYGTSFNYGDNQTEFIDENGESFTYFYDNQYQITGINGPVTAEEPSAQEVVTQGVKAQGYKKASLETTPTTGALVHYEYDNLGNRTKVTDAKGLTTSYQYDLRNNLLAVTDTTGAVTQYVYDNNDNLVKVTDANNKTSTIDYDSRGNLLTTTNPLGETTNYTYDAYGQALTITDAGGKTVAYQYDYAGNVRTTKDGNGNITQYFYDAVGRNKEIIDAKGNITTLVYDKIDNLVREVSPAGEVVNTYDKNGNLIGTKDPEGNVTTYQFDERNNLVKGIDPLLNVTTTTYDKTGRQTAVSDAEGKVTKFAYDALGQLKKTTDPVGDVVEYFYDTNGNRTGEKDAQGQVTKYEYDPLNRIKAAIDPLQQRTEYTYDAVGNTVNYKGSDGTVTEYKYDPLARVVETIDPLMKSTKFTYDVSGNQQTVTNALGQTYTYYYDGNNNLAKVVDPDGKTTEFEYDANNNQVAVKDALGNITRYVYDNQNRLINVIDPLNRGNQFELDKNGSRTKVTDGNGNTTRYEYDAVGRLRYVTDPKYNKTEYQYDKNGSLLKFIDAKGNATRYEYNLKNLLIKQVNPLGQATKFEYDKNGNILAKIDAKGQRIEYAYDQLNRLLGTYYPDGKYVEYGYNKQGKREWMEDNFGTSWYDYDTLGRLTAVTNQDDMTMEYEYNSLGQKTKVKYPDGKDVKYDYDQSNRLTKVTDRVGKVTAYDYDALGRRSKTTLPNGIETTYDYDKANQLKAIASTNDKQKLLAKYQYEYDAAGNRVSIAETAEDQVYTTKYNYDPLNQLEEVLNPDGTKVNYQYDQVGNRTKMFNLAGTTLTSTNYYYNEANELTKTNLNDSEFTRYEYDANGNRVAKIQPENVVTRYTWDYENRLTNVLMHQGKFVSYEYDGDGNRMGKIAGVKKPLMKEKPNQGNVNKQQAKIIYNATNNGNGNGNGGNNSNAGGNGNGNGNNGDNGNAGGNGNGKDKDDPDGDKNGKGKDKDKTDNSKDHDKAKNKDLTKEERNKKKENAKQGKGYREKGKYNNKGKHLGWYKNKNKNKLEQQLEETYYLNDVSEGLSQVMMTYDERGMFDTAYTYGNERIGIDILDGTRPDAQNPLYYLYDGQGSVSYITKPDGEIRDTYKYDEYGKPRDGKLSPDGDKILHTNFGYTGEQWDEESRLQYLRARYYDPEEGRFLSRDTYEGQLKNPLSKHLYAYVGNNPVNYKDPSGHKADPGTDEWFNDYIPKHWTPEQIIHLQKFLNKWNASFKLKVNGIYNSKTKKAHIKWWNATHLTAVSDNGLNYIANLEVGKKDLVLDSSGNILEIKPTVNNTTIGYGYDLTQDPLNLGIKKAKNISQATALEYLKRVSNKYAKKIATSSDITVPLSQYQLDALVALKYNVGSLGVIPNLFNDINNRASYNTFQKHIYGYYESLVKKYPSKAQYLEGWKNRTDSILNIYFNGDYGSMPINAVKGTYK